MVAENQKNIESHSCSPGATSGYQIARDEYGPLKDDCNLLEN